MARWVRIFAFVMLALAVPATAQTFGFSLAATEPACLSIGNATYRLTNTGRADVTIRIDPVAAPDIRIQIADAPDEADFVFVDDGAAAPTCPRGPFKTVGVDAAAAAPDLVVGLPSASAPADYRIYVRSRWLDAETAVALFAAAQVPTRALGGRMSSRSN